MTKTPYKWGPGNKNNKTEKIVRQFERKELPTVQVLPRCAPCVVCLLVSSQWLDNLVLKRIEKMQHIEARQTRHALNAWSR